MGRHTAPNRDLTASKRGGIAPLEARHAGDTPWRGFSCCKTPTITRTERGCDTHERKGQAAAPSHPIMGQLYTGP